MSEGIVLVGPPGSGKTSVGRCLAERLGRPFVDLDERITQRTGRTPAEHLERDGEPAFRALERREVEATCRGDATIVGTGGGTVLDPLNRWAFARHGVIVSLDAPVERLADRLRRDPVPRPLLAGDADAALRRLLDERRPFYRAADTRVDASADPAAVASHAADAVAARRRAAVTWRVLFDAEVARDHPIGPERTRVVYGRDLDSAGLDDVLAPFAGRVAAVVADRRALDSLPVLASVLPAARRTTLRGGERLKRLREVERLADRLSEQGLERGDPVLAVGGGTIGDLVGLVAALFGRGVPIVHVPTTWLAQTDSAIGGKTGVDLARAKNALGAFWPPWAVVGDVALLRSLPPRHLRDGLAESVKAALIADPALWDLLETRGREAVSGSDEAARYAITERAMRVKLDVVGRDPFERGERRVLNLGHTLGHALEIAAHYRLPHGAAVALGLRAVASIAAGRSGDPTLARRIDALLATLGFRLRIGFDRAAVVAALGTDKKRDRGRQRWILPLSIGSVAEVDDVSEAELERALATIEEPR